MSAVTILVAATGLIFGLRFNAFVLGLLLLLGVETFSQLAFGAAVIWLLLHCMFWQCSHPSRSVISLGT